ncbi:FUN14 domain-containing protein 1-like isoform X1 [Homarus americanus]|uniref:FUN14 domain-containing protein 1-like isoform X1 n=1 Tax=Homarus americanus TaxID=6706 RepID=UPI001C4552C9|nr:FUN14 domain-containing protein 1-like isoform X1 [Homarus americanus]
MGGSSQTKPKKPTDEEEFEVLDVRGTARSGMSWLQQFMQDLTKQPVTKQVAVGGLSGWVVGYLSMKVGKVAATVVGGSLIIMQLAAHKGYIKVDWNRVNRDLEKNAKKLKQEVESTVNARAGDENILQETTRQMDRKLEKLDRKLTRSTKAESWFNKLNEFDKEDVQETHTWGQ